MPSTDSRFQNAEGDIWQHRVNNYDWDDQWIFCDDRFELANGPDEVFLNFIAEMAHPVVRADREQAKKIVAMFNERLAPDGWALAEKSTISGRLIYGPQRLTTSQHAINAAKSVAQVVDADYIHRQINRMLESLGDVQKSLQHVASSGKVGPAIDLLARLKGFIDRGVVDQRKPFTRVRQYTRQVRHVMKLLTSEDGLPLAKRKSRFAAKLDELQRREDDRVYVHFAKVMTSFRPGLFVRAKLAAYPRDNLDLERLFRSPKSHERRIHGHRHAGVRIVRDGPTLIPTLDAHASHPQVFSREDLFPFRFASPPPSQVAAQQRHVIMRQSRSKKNDASCSEH